MAYGEGFFFQPSPTGLAQVERESQTRYNKILDSKNLINTYSCTGHRMSLHIFGSMLIKQVDDLREVRTKNFSDLPE